MGYFKRIRYPDGQIGAEFVEGPLSSSSVGLLGERINSYEDLFYVRAVADIIQHNNIKGWELYIPCMFGQRSDRRFSMFQSFDLKLIADVINECGFEKVKILDPHSDMTLGLINHSEKISSLPYVRQAVDLLARRSEAEHNYSVSPLLVSPDAGAFKKVFEFGEATGCEVMGANKHRDGQGNVDLIFTHDVENRECLIVDDLCDGGRTFEILAKELKKNKASRVYLYVTHGIFSRGFSGLFDAGISHVFCTNSVRDIDTENVAIKVKTSEDMHPNNMFSSDYVTQFKVI
jgi:ribose-phosphate pyrophosphokinase